MLYVPTFIVCLLRYFAYELFTFAVTVFFSHKIEYQSFSYVTCLQEMVF